MYGVLYFFVVQYFLAVNCLNDILMGVDPLYGISKLSEELQNKTTCYMQLNDLQKAINEEKVWAIKAMDASGRPESGFIYGNNLWIGSHVQCNDISNRKKLEINNNKIAHISTPYDYPPFPMGFSMVFIKHNSTLQHHTQLPLEWTIQLGLCVPNSCTSEEIHYLARIYFNGDFLEMQKLYHLDLEVTEVKKLAEDIIWFLKLPKTILLCLARLKHYLLDFCRSYEGMVVSSNQNTQYGGPWRLLFRVTRAITYIDNLAETQFPSLLVLILFLTIAGTIYDVRRHNREKNCITGHNGNLNGKSTISTIELVSSSSTEDLAKSSTIGEILKCFSIYSNTKNLVKTKLSADSIGCIHGLRFLGMMWVILVHAVYFQADYLNNVAFAYRLSEDIFAQILSNSTYCVDTYLFLSGFLVAYLFYKSKNPHEKSDKPINYISKTSEFIFMYINRFFRLTPPYLVILLFTDVVYTFYKQNSSLLSSENAGDLCDKYWWRNLLYINNLFPRKEMCMSWSWYLSLDTQFFTITIFLLIVSTIAFKFSAVVVFFLILVNISATAYKSYSIGYIPTMDEQLAQLDAIYDLPWNRIGPYLVGVITAYVLLIKLKNKLILSKRKKVLLWVVFPILNLWIVFTLYTRQISLEFSAVYMGISRTLWGVGMAWILIACCTGNAQALKKFLSFKGFIPLSRLTYCAYLLNPLAANIIYLGSEAPSTASLAGFAVTSLGITMTTFYMSFLVSVLIESPFILLTKMAFKKIRRRSKDVAATSSRN